MDHDGWGFAADALLQVGTQTFLGGAAGNDTIAAAGGGLATAIFPAFLLPSSAMPAAAPETLTGAMTFADPLAFALPDSIAAGLPPAALPAIPDLPAAGLTVLETTLPASLVTATLPDGTTLGFADFAVHGF